LLTHLETPGLEIKSLLVRVTKDVVEETKGMQRPGKIRRWKATFILCRRRW
jgi:hypothetical protein